MSTEEPQPSEIVESYSLILRERGGFTFVVLQILTADQKTYAFEFAPGYAHHLSDELLRTAASAAPRVSDRAG